MFVVTNRELDERGKTTGPDRFGKKLNSLGANELRMAEAVWKANRWTVTVVPDEATPKMKNEVGLASATNVTGGRYVARRVLGRINPERGKALGVKKLAPKGRNLLFFVHGFNNNMRAVLDRAHRLETLYGVEVVAFSWPANGGGVTGVSSYRSDKRDAKASIGALDRALHAMVRMLGEFNADQFLEIRRRAERKFKDDPEQRERFINHAISKSCPFTVNALFHSMGNYLYKHMVKSDSSEGKGLLFDNVVLAAADTNTENHADWVDRIRCRRRLYITINEDDQALGAARMKIGDEQKARLGHYPYALHSRQGVYVQFTGVPKVNDSHSYFEGDPVTKNPRIKKFFKEAFNGRRAESRLEYDTATNMYLFT